MAPKTSSWVVLSPNKLPSANEASNLLGAVVLDFKDPQGDSEPDDVFSFMKSFDHLRDESEESDFLSVVQGGVAHSTYLRLGDILRTQFGKDSDDSQDMRSTYVRTLW